MRYGSLTWDSLAKLAIIILSRDDPDALRALVTYVPLTTRNRSS
jgi:hypothetical protein